MRLALLIMTMAIAAEAVAAPADQFEGVEVKAAPVSGSVYMLTGAGGNLAVSIGPDGTLLVDDQYAPLAPRIQAAIDALSGQAPRLILNTHFHGDHTGGNVTFGAHGVIIAHDNVRRRLLEEEIGRTGLPLVTFADRIRIQFNDDEIDVIHLPAGHTDGDTFVWFKTANVVHLGDHFFNGRFPYVDVDSGGTVDGYLENVTRVLDTVPADVRIIPGHGPLASVVELAQFKEMIERTRGSVRAALNEGRSIDDVIATGLPAQYKAFGSGSITEDRWIRTIQLSDQQRMNGGATRR